MCQLHRGLSDTRVCQGMTGWWGRGVTEGSARVTNCLYGQAVSDQETQHAMSARDQVLLSRPGLGDRNNLTLGMGMWGVDKLHEDDQPGPGMRGSR